MKFLYIEIIIAIFATFVYCDCNSFKATFEGEEGNVSSCIENENGDIINLEVFSRNLNENDLDKIGSLVSLQKLILSTDSTEADLTPLNKLKNLVEFTLEGVYDFYEKERNTLKKTNFSAFKNLKILFLSDWIFTQDVLNDFSSLNNLERLEYYGLVRPEVLEAFGSISSVQSIYIYTRSSSGIDLSPLHKLKKLEKLEFECRVHKVRTVSYGFKNNSLGGFENLKSLNLYGFTFENHTIEDISNMPSIEEIIFHRCNYVNVGNFEALEKINGHLKSLTFQGYKYFKSVILAKFPEITSLTNLKKLEIVNTNVNEIPETISNLKSLEHLTISLSGIQEIPGSILKLKNLKHLDLSRNSITAFPNGLSNSKNLEYLDLANNDIVTLPSDFNKLNKLQYLSLSSNSKINNLNILKNLKNLNTLYLSYLEITEYPSWLKNLSSLEFLDLSGNEITSLSSSIGNLVNLKTLNVSYNLLSDLPSNFKKLTNILYLDISHNSFTTIPKYVKYLKNIIDLNVDYNAISVIPEFIGDMTSLKALSIDENKITTIPTFLSKLKNLEELYLNYNEISELPNIFKNMKNIKFIELKYNAFTSYPSAICEIKTISELSFDIAYNHIVNETVPECYSKLYYFHNYSQSESS